MKCHRAPLRPAGLRAFLVTAVGLTLMISGCATVGNLAEEDAPVLSGLPADETTVVDGAPPQLRIDPRGLVGSADRVVVAASLDTESAGRWDIPLTGAQLEFSLPVEGLEDGRRYQYRFWLARGDRRLYEISGPWMVEFALGLVTPVVDTEPVASLDRRHSFAWSLPGDDFDPSELRGTQLRYTGSSAVEGAQFEVPAPAQSVRPPENLYTFDEIRSGRQLTWQARVVSQHGLLGPWSASGTVIFDPAAAIPVPRGLTGGFSSVVAAPGLSWLPIPGAEEYLLRIGVEGSPRPVMDLQLAETRRILSSRDLDRLFAGGEDQRSIWWEIAAAAGGNGGVRTPWSERFFFRYRPIVGALAEVVSPEVTVTITLGSDNPVEPDEGPEVSVAVNRPFAMMRYELTNTAVADLVAIELAAGRLVFDGDTLRLGAGGPLVLGLGELDFGEQYGLTVEDGAVRVRDGYAGHPAAGVSWFGAAVFANALSRQAGFPEAYAISGREVRLVMGSPGFRLPSEAEWAVALALPAPIAVVESSIQVFEDRSIGSAELRGSNYQRSGDPWEALQPPWDANGGPTSPVGALGYARPSGVYDALGNLWEWTGDWYRPDWYRQLSSAGEDAAARALRGPAEAAPDVYGRALRTVRGTAWNTPQEAVRPGNRGAFAQEATSHSIGVRLVRSLGP